MFGIFAQNEPEILSCRPADFSFYFDLIKGMFSGSFKNCDAIHRICSHVRKVGATHIAIEQLEPTGELAAELDDINIRCNGVKQSHFHRLSFFYAPDSKGNTLELDKEFIFLGYVVITALILPNDEDRSYVFESVLLPPSRCRKDYAGKLIILPVTNTFVHCHRLFKSTLGTQNNSKDLAIDGSFFCQQNALTHVCAHACLRMAVNTYGSPKFGKLTNQIINSILGIDHRTESTRLTGYNKSNGKLGLSIQEMIQVVSDTGHTPHGLNFLIWPEIDFAKYIYPFIESGIPAILSFNSSYDAGHVITVVGHTMNSDKWDCEAHMLYYPNSQTFGRYHASSRWVDHFLVNDDNFGVYSAMPLEYLRNPVMPKYDLTKRAGFMLTFMPEGGQISPYAAESHANVFLGNCLQTFKSTSASDPSTQFADWMETLILLVVDQCRRVTMRTLLGDKETYLKYLFDPSNPLVDSDGNQVNQAILDKLDLQLPDHFWVTEYSLPDLYTANKHKLGDMLHSIGSGQGKGPEFLWGWGPGVEFFPTEYYVNWPLTGHVKLYGTDVAAKPVDIY